MLEDNKHLMKKKKKEQERGKLEVSKEETRCIE